MDHRIIYAVAWKEFRQLSWILYGFAALALILIVLLFVQHNSNEMSLNQVQKSLIIYAFVGTFCLSYLLAAGNRVVESSTNLESFLLTRPVSRLSLFQTYFFTGLVVWVVWIGIYIVLQCAFFGIREIFLENQYFLSKEYFRVLIIFLIVYTLTYCIAVLLPNLYVTVLTCIASFLLLGKVTDLSIEQRKSFSETFFYFTEMLISKLLPMFGLIFLFFLLIAFTFFMYSHKQAD